MIKKIINIFFICTIQSLQAAQNEQEADRQPLRSLQNTEKKLLKLYLEDFYKKNYGGHYENTKEEIDLIKDVDWNKVSQELHQPLIAGDNNDTKKKLFDALKKINTNKKIENDIEKINKIQQIKDNKLNMPWPQMIGIYFGIKPNANNIEYKNDNDKDDILPNAIVNLNDIIKNEDLIDDKDITEKKNENKKNIKFERTNNYLAWLFGEVLGLLSFLAGTGIYYKNDFSYKFSWLPLLTSLGFYMIINKTYKEGEKSLIKTINDNLNTNKNALEKEKKSGEENNIDDNDKQTLHRLLMNSKTLRKFYWQNNIKYTINMKKEIDNGEMEKIENEDMGREKKEQKEKYKAKLTNLKNKLEELMKDPFFEEPKKWVIDDERGERNAEE